MAARRKTHEVEKEYWSDVCIALSQVTFGVAWASLFLPLDLGKMGMVLLNLVVTVLLIVRGLFLRRSK